TSLDCGGWSGTPVHSRERKLLRSLSYLTHELSFLLSYQPAHNERGVTNERSPVRCSETVSRWPNMFSTRKRYWHSLAMPGFGPTVEAPGRLSISRQPQRTSARLS